MKPHMHAHLKCHIHVTSPFPIPTLQAEKALTPGALLATLRRICSPKPSSGKLEVSAEVHKQWALGGKSRKALLSLLAKVKGDKDSCW